MRKLKIYTILFIIFFIFGMHANASIVINGTRVIYPENEKEVTVQIKNKGTDPVLLQNWLDTGNIDESPDNINIPFILTPPINRVNAEKSQTLRIQYIGDTLPLDRESVFWLNVLEIPKTKVDLPENRLQIAFRSRIKLFYRPAQLKGNAIEAASSLQWSIKNKALVIQNTSEYHVSLISISFSHLGKEKVIEADMISPFSSQEIPLEFDISKGDVITYEYIDDWGATRKHSVNI